MQRILLLDYNKTTKRIQLRHYSISAQPSGVSKSVKALVSQRALPDMGAVQDVSEFLSKSGYGSVSFSDCGLTISKKRKKNKILTLCGLQVELPDHPCDALLS